MIAERIRYYRKLRQCTQEVLARRSGVTHATLIKLESGVNTNPTLKTMTKLARALNITLIDLLK